MKHYAWCIFKQIIVNIFDLNQEFVYRKFESRVLVNFELRVRYLNGSLHDSFRVTRARAREKRFGGFCMDAMKSILSLS